MLPFFDMTESTGFKRFQRESLGLPGMVFSVGCLLFASMAAGQALTVRSLEAGTEVVLVTETLAEMSAGCWPIVTEEGAWEGRCVIGSDLTFTAELEGALGDLEVAPSVVVIVGGSGRREPIDKVASVLVGKDLALRPPAGDSGIEEGGQERRLGRPGGASVLRLEVQLPAVDHPDRTAVEILWNLLPNHLMDADPGLRSRIEGDIGSLQYSVDDDLGGVELRSLRLALAQISGSPSLKADEVEREAHRLRIARSAELESVESAGLELLSLWIRGGSDGIRQYLFGPDGVTLGRVRQAAARWLPRHPGHAVFLLPPRHFRPRFAPGPQSARMANDLSATILARPSAHLATLVLRPVLLADLTGDAEAVILTQLATVLRRSDSRLPYVVVEGRPPRLELAAGSGDFPGLCEALQGVLAEVASDTMSVTVVKDARRQALRLMAGVLGMGTDNEVSPATVLAPGNIAIGGVAVDAELALEALEKFEVGGRSPGVTLGGMSGGDGRRRMPAAGTWSAVAVALPLASGFPIPETVAEILSARIGQVIEGATGEVLLPLIPGKSVMVLVVVREGAVSDLEDALRESWAELFGPTTEEDLTPIRRKVATRVVSASGGVLGRARVCAAIAAGADSWRTPRDREMAALTVDVVEVNLDLERLVDMPEAEWTASGPAAVSLGD